MQNYTNHLRSQGHIISVKKTIVHHPKPIQR